MNAKIKEWNEYFSANCYLPAAAIRDLFEYIDELGAMCEFHVAEAVKADEVVLKENAKLKAEVKRLRATLERYADPDWWPEQLQHRDFLRKPARKALAQGVCGDE